LTGVPQGEDVSTFVEDERPIWQRGHMATRNEDRRWPPAGALCLAALLMDTPVQMDTAPVSIPC